MNFFNRLKNAYYMLAGRPLTDGDRRVLDFLGINSSSIPRNALSQTTYFTCMKVLSEMMGKMPFKEYQQTAYGIQRPEPNDACRLLSTRPNPYMSSTAYWTMSEFYRNQYGNTCSLIDWQFDRHGRYGGEYKINGFYLMHPDYVTVYMDDAGIFKQGEGRLFYEYTNPDTGEQFLFHDSEVIHVTTWLREKNGIIGKPTLEILRESIEGAGAAAAYENNLFKNNLTARMVLQYTGNFDKERVEEIQRRYGDKLTGTKAAGRVISIPAGLTLTPLNMSMVDADFVNLRKLSALQIAACFQIKPSFLNDYEHSKYASSESEMLAFLSNFSYTLKAYEDEYNAKALTPREVKEGYFYKFNEKSVLRIDSKTQSEVLKNYVQGGIYTPNEARDYLDKPHVEGGDTLLVNGSYVPILEAGAAYQSRGGKKS